MAEMETKGIAGGKSNDSKISRKDGEKIRRDKLNNLIAQLAKEVPTISYAQRKPDKLAILRLTVSYLKLHNGLKKRKVMTQCLRSFGYLFSAAKKASNGVMFIMTESGTILYVSENIRNVLGFNQMDVTGFNIRKFIHSDDHKTFTSQFVQESVTLASFQKGINLTAINNIEFHSQNKNSYYLRMLHSSKKRQDDDSIEYIHELMHFSSYRDHGNQQEGCEPWIVAFMKPLQKESINEIDVKVSEFMNCNDFATLHDLDGTILASDHRGSLFHGFMVGELVGKTPYAFVLEEDLKSIALSHQLILKEDEIPITVYRMKTRFLSQIFLQSKSVIVCDKWTKQPKCIVSTNTFYEEADGKKLLEEQNRKLAELQGAVHTLPIDDTSHSSFKSPASSAYSPFTAQSSMDGFAQYTSSSEYSAPAFDENLKSPLSEMYEKEAKKFPHMYSRWQASDESQSHCNIKRSYDDSEQCDTDKASEEFNNHTASKECDKECDNPTPSEECNKEFDNDKANKECANHKENEECDYHKANTTDPIMDLFSKYHGKSVDFVKTEYTLKELIEEAKESSGSVDNYSNNKKSMNNLSEKKRKSSNSKCQDQPILKGILEDHLTLNKFETTGKWVPCEMPQDHEKREQRDSECTNDEDYCPPASRVDTAIDASDRVAIQSSTVGSSDPQPNFKLTFAQQLEFKHTQLEETLISQKSILQNLWNQLQGDTRLNQLDETNSLVQQDLLGKILEAENKVYVQSKLLDEIQRELLSQREEIDFNSTES